MKTKLQTDIAALKETVKAAAGHPFLPAPARDTIVQACALIEQLAGELAALQEIVRFYGLRTPPKAVEPTSFPPLRATGF